MFIYLKKWEIKSLVYNRTVPCSVGSSTTANHRHAETHLHILAWKITFTKVLEALTHICLFKSFTVSNVSDNTGRHTHPTMKITMDYCWCWLNQHSIISRHVKKLRKPLWITWKLLPFTGNQCLFFLFKWSSSVSCLPHIDHPIQWPWFTGCHQSLGRKHIQLTQISMFSQVYSWRIWSSGWGV